MPSMPSMPRKVWVKRPGASPTMVRIQEDDLVDDVRDAVLAKYANSLGRTFDAPDVVIRLAVRPDAGRIGPDRILSPEEVVCRILDAYYPNGQNIEDALLVEIPPKRTPKVSPRPHPLQHIITTHSGLESSRPEESSTDYFPPMPAIIQGQNGIAHDQRLVQPHSIKMPDHVRSISILHTGQVPALPSPGPSTRRHRPKYPRQITSSPTMVTHTGAAAAAAVPSTAGGTGPPLAPAQPSLHRSHNRPRLDSHATERPNGLSLPAPPLATPPAIEGPPAVKLASTPPTPSARELNLHRPMRPKRSRRATPTNPSGLKVGGSTALPLDNSVPPINVLIVEDNHINLKVLEAFMKRLRVRWSTAMNGQIAVNKWRAGGFHLVLMDIQLPIMSGLEATKEIRRLERVNGIGVFSNSTPSTPHAKARQKSTDAALDVIVPEESDTRRDVDNVNHDQLVMDEGLFKSPVIIVALTASSLQSDRHEALAAGCNDFLTKVCDT